MFNVIIRTSDGPRARRFDDKPAAMNWAVQTLIQMGKSVQVSIESDSGIVFTHEEIVHAYGMVRL